MFQRTLNIKEVAENKSIFLFGPRQTGKSTLVRTTFPHCLMIDLLHSETFRALSANPERLREWVSAEHSKTKNRIIVVDEIQKLPGLLDEIHSLMERDKELRFILTGSSARKLRRAGVNLLGGRARRLSLNPITSLEFLTDASQRNPLQTLVQWGGLPSILTSKTPSEDLEDYLGTYLREEIQAEAIVRSIESFSRFLNVAALVNAEQILFSNVASDSEVPARTVREYFQVLEDTLVGKLLPAFRQTKKRKAMGAAKFYFFDVGVANALLGRWSLKPGTPEYGKSLEHLVWRECESAISYFRIKTEISYWRSLSKFEVDFIFLSEGAKTPFLAVEAKAKTSVGPHDLRGLLAFAEEYPKIRKVVVCLEPVRRNLENGIELWPAETFLTALWKREWM